MPMRTTSSADAAPADAASKSAAAIIERSEIICAFRGAIIGAFLPVAPPLLSERTLSLR
jgi:hypothetical protein